MDAVAYVVSPSLFATVGDRPPLSSEWYAWFYLERSVFAAQADANVGLLSPESPEWYAWYFAERVLAASGGAVTSEISSQLTSYIAEISAIGGIGAIASVNSQQLAINAANIGANSQISATASVITAESTANAAIITANGEQKDVFKGGGYETYQEYFLDVRAKVVGANAIVKAGKVNAFGLIVNNAVARPISAISDSNLSNISANGILDIDESELLLLLIA